MFCRVLTLSVSAHGTAALILSLPHTHTHTHTRHRNSLLLCMMNWDAPWYRVHCFSRCFLQNECLCGCVYTALSCFFYLHFANEAATVCGCVPVVCLKIHTPSYRITGFGHFLVLFHTLMIISAIPNNTAFPKSLNRLYPLPNQTELRLHLIIRPHHGFVGCHPETIENNNLQRCDSSAPSLGCLRKERLFCLM